MLEFEMMGRKCCVKCLDADVNMPLGSVSAMVEEGNTVVFSKKLGSYVENDVTGEKIPLERKGGTYVMTLQTFDDKNIKLTKKDMEINGLGEGEGEGGEEGRRDEDMGVFMRRVL